MKETGQGITMVARPPRHEETLRSADVGVALGSNGQGLETAGIVLKSENPALAVKAVELTSGGLRRVPATGLREP